MENPLSPADTPLVPDSIEDLSVAGDLNSHPPSPPTEALEIPWKDYLLYFLGALSLWALSLVKVYNGGTWVWAILAGFCTVSIFYLQHEIYHSPFLTDSARANWINLLALITGFNMQQWLIHGEHHAFTGQYKGMLIQSPKKLGQTSQSFKDDGDLDDYLGILRQDTFLKKFASTSWLSRFLVATLPFLITIPLFHGLMVLVSTYRALTQKLWLEAILPLLGVAGLFYVLGFFPTLIYSLTFSILFMATIASAHIPDTADTSQTSYWQRQVLQTRNLKSRPNFLIKVLTWFSGYHMEHHLWPSVPMPNLPLCETLAKEYAHQQGLDDYEESLSQALGSWWQKSWILAGTDVSQPGQNA